MTIEELEKRLRAIEDIEEIKKLHYRYINCLMFAKWDEIMDCFWDNSTFDFAGAKGGKVVKGKAEITKLFKKRFSKTHVGKEGDLLVHPLISVDGDKAKGNWVLYMMYFHPRTWQSLLWVQGIYDCEYAKENGQWKISYLKFRTRLEPPDGPPDPHYLLHFLT